jgi:hypothetical protein
MIRNYSELSKLKSFKDRFDYLTLKGVIGEDTFGHDRYINQLLYKSKKWKDARDVVIIRDNGCDLGILGNEIFDTIIVHHMNPITIEDIENNIPELYDPEYLVAVSVRTHRAIHYADDSILKKDLVVRSKNDTTPWRK